MEGVLICAHSGFGGTPEGSLAALRRGAEAGHPMAEVDVRLTRDGIPVLNHDEALPCMPEARIADLRWAELSALRPGLVLFSKALTVVRALGLSLNIDLKMPLAAEPCAALCVQTGMAGRCYFSGLGPKDARLVAGLRLPVRHLLNVSEELAAVPRRAVDMGLALEAFGLNLQYRLVTPELVEQAHRHFLWVWAWTVNDCGEAERLSRMGVNGVTTRGFVGG